MNLNEIINERRAYRSLDHIDITQEIIKKLGKAAQLSPSCFNNQPWNYIFVYDDIKLDEMKQTLSKGNEWAHDASLIIAVCAKKEDDCIIYDREYYLFDTGLATAFLILTATDMRLVAHPIAGYSPKKVRSVLNIPEEYQVITLVIVGKHAKKIKPILSEKQKETEIKRPKRKPLKTIVHHNMFNMEV